MNTRNPVPLVRRFSPVPESLDDSEEQQIQAFLGNSSLSTWEDIDKGFRAVVLAEAGAGKTFELKARATYVEAQGQHAFFIRIEEILYDFGQSFEVGNANSFEQWLRSQNDAWFYLDSVDEARLENPSAFSRAIRRFNEEIKNAQHRAHVCISSRPYAWRPQSDRQLIEQLLLLPKPSVEATRKDLPSSDSPKPPTAVDVFLLQPLDEKDIRKFAQHRSAKNVDRLIHDLERKDLLALAGRPFDLETILEKWASDQTLGGRRDLLHHNVMMRLKESHHPDRARRQPLNLDKALDGARRLAAAVILTGESGIQVPDSCHTLRGIDADAVLSEWEPTDVQALLERAIFDDVIYGTVRFRHRDVREFLAAGWFSKLLQRGHSRHEVESLFFREQYGHHFISPRLRVVLPWLILDDTEVRSRILKHHPEVIMEGGDPAQLPLPIREIILSNVVERLVQHEECGAASDNTAVARLAHADLTDHILALIERYPENDEALFFLARLVWQGALSGCVPRLLGVAADAARGTHVRIAATRAVTTCGTKEHHRVLWDTLLASDEEIPREILADLIRSADERTIPKVLESIEKCSPDSHFSLTSLKSALRDFVGRLPLPSAGDIDAPLAVLVRGLHGFLKRPLFIRPGSCDISENYSWLLGPAMQAIERLVAGRNTLAFGDHSMALLRHAPTAWRLVRNSDVPHDTLSKLVPGWPDLNDALFWYSASAIRTERGTDGLGLNSDWPLQRLEHYWAFGPDTFQRILSYVRTRKLKDDQVLALSLAFRVYRQAEEPSEWLQDLYERVGNDKTLSIELDNLLNPCVPEDVAKQEREWESHKRELEREIQEAEQNRAEWIARLKADPGVVRRPSDLQPGEFSIDQCFLLRELENEEVRAHRSHGSTWRALIDEFGEDVAYAYRDAAMAHWRHFRPELRSEGGDTNSIPYSLIFAMAGLAIEAEEVDGFPQYLSDSDVCLALRYIVFELNGFPRWLESMYLARPKAVLDSILTELFWELENTVSGRSLHYILHDLAIYAPWIHHALAGPLLCWIRSHDLPSGDALDYCFRILRGGELDRSELVMVAKAKAIASSQDQRAYWYAVWVDAQPETGIDALQACLESLCSDDASLTAQLFVTALMGNGRNTASAAGLESLQTPQYLKSLYLLMHRYIRVTEDIDRSGGGVYSPGLRDHAQEAREGLFNLLSEIPGKETYVALSELIDEHPNPTARPRMERLARRRADLDGDVEPWIAEQVAEFADTLTRTPTSHRQLFDLTVARVTDLKDWIERGRDSPYRIWQKADDEGEIRTLVAGWLNSKWANPFTVAEEPQLANNQRMDIWLQNQKVSSPVPIELKLLDKNWTGPKLCERLRNQLVGDYMREVTGGCGLMLLVWQGNRLHRRWKVDGRLVRLEELRNALKGHWNSIANAFPEAEAVEVILLDLSLRGTRSSRVAKG